MSAEMIERLASATGLPSPLGVARRVLDHSEADDAGLLELGEAIGGDPGLAGAVLRFGNARSVVGSAPAPTVRECVNRIGPRALRVVAVSHLLASAEHDPVAAGAALSRVWARGLARSIVARRLAQHFDPRRAAEVHQAAALMDVSVVALWCVDARACAEALGSGDADAALRSAFGMSAAEMSAEILRAWRVSKRVWSPMRALGGDAPIRNGSAEGVHMHEVLRSADALAGAMTGWANPRVGEESGLSIDRGLLRTLSSAAEEEWEHRRGVLEMPGQPAGAAAAVRARAQQVLMELSLATQLENRVMLRRQQELMRRVTTDSLTQVKNRLAFDERLGEEFERCQRSGKPLALFLADLDHFKRFNDEHGHQAGDLMLRTAAGALANAARRVDMVARYGGEEFVVIAPDCGIAGAQAVAERLRRSVEETPAEWRGQAFTCTASIGGIVLTPGGVKPAPSELVAAADRLLYAAKRAGRNRAIVEVFGEGESERAASNGAAGRAAPIP